MTDINSHLSRCEDPLEQTWKLATNFAFSEDWQADYTQPIGMLPSRMAHYDATPVFFNHSIDLPEKQYD